MDIACAFPPVPDTPDHIALAESLGYRRAWVYDTPALQLDVWSTLALAAERTNRIELVPGVLIPSLRHVLVTASAVATLVSLAPGRVNVGIGSGFTGRLAMGQRANRWSYVADYARQHRGLLDGKTVEGEESPVRMLHGPGQARKPHEHSAPWSVSALPEFAPGADQGGPPSTTRVWPVTKRACFEVRNMEVTSSQ